MGEAKRRSQTLALVAGMLLAAASAWGQGLLPSKGELDGGDPFALPPAPAVAQPAEPGEGPVSVDAVAERPLVAPGGELAVAIVLDHRSGWHTWPSAAQDVLPREVARHAIRTAIETPERLPAWIEKVGPIQWPEPHEVLAANPSGGPPIPLMSYEGRAIAYLPVLVSQSAEIGDAELTLTVSYQACDDSVCMPPESVGVTASLRVAPLDEIAASAGAGLTGEGVAPLFAEFDSAVYAAVRSGELSAETAGDSARRSFFGIPLPNAGSAAGLAVLALLGMAGGVILNLTPCVLPVIPLKVMAMQAHSDSPRRLLVLGGWMALGVTAFWVALGIVAASVTGWLDPSRLFGIWWVTALLGLAIGAFGVGSLGVFEVTLPKQVYAVNPEADSPAGSFVFGVMTAVLGLPCFGFVAGALLAGAAALPATVIVTVFASLGVGMAAPYLALSAKPAWVKKIPKTGPASELVKQVMGLMMLAAAAYFVGSAAIALTLDLTNGGVGLPWWAKQVHWWAIALLALAAGGWLIVRTFQITAKPLPRVALASAGLVIGGAAVAYAADSTHRAYQDPWVAFAPDRVAAELDAGNVVVVDFTAEWCLNCKALKAAVLSRPPVKPELLAAGVTPIVVDLTSNSGPGRDYMNELGQTGIPLLLIDGPGLDEPWMANAYTSEQVLAAIGRARGDADPETPGLRIEADVDVDVTVSPAAES